MGKINYRIFNNILQILKIWDFYILLYKKLPNYYNSIINKKYKNQDRFLVNIFGVSFFISIQDTYSKKWVFIRCDQGIIHEEKATELLGEKLKDSKCFVDIGAHLGYFTLFASKIIPEGQIISFELDKINFYLLKKNIELNNCKNVEIFNNAVTDKPGKIEYKRDSDQPMPNLNILVTTSNNSFDKMISVDSVVLDDFFKNRTVKPNIIKIDVEGAEMNVLKGMKNLIKSYKPNLFLEIHPDILPKFNSSAEEVISYLKEKGYKIYEFTDMRKFWKDRNIRELDINSKIDYNAMLFAY